MARILVVDDKIDIANLCYELLKKEGYKVTVVYNPEIALTEIALTKMEGREEFDLLITDLNMPVMNGLQLLDAVRKLGKTIPAIAMTGNILDWDSDALTKFNKVLTKPFSNIKEIVSAVKEVLAQPLSDNE